MGEIERGFCLAEGVLFGLIGVPHGDRGPRRIMAWPRSYRPWPRYFGCGWCGCTHPRKTRAGCRAAYSRNAGAPLSSPTCHFPPLKPPTHSSCTPPCQPNLQPNTQILTGPAHDRPVPLLSENSILYLHFGATNGRKPLAFAQPFTNLSTSVGRRQRRRAEM